MTYADSILGAVYEAVVDPGKGLAAAKRDYRFERYVSGLEDRGVDEVDFRLTFPDPETINPFFYLPRFYLELSPHTADEAFDRREPGPWRRLAVRLVPVLARTGWLGGSDALQISVPVNKPKRAYENASDLFERWLHELEDRGFTVHKDYEFPRGLQSEIPEEDRRPW
ncbi:MAG: hypothetical protein ABEJ81_09285 [Haloferacaceae archaeon]